MRTAREHGENSTWRTGCYVLVTLVVLVDVLDTQDIRTRAIRTQDSRTRVIRADNSCIDGLTGRQGVCVRISSCTNRPERVTTCRGAVRGVCCPDTAPSPGVPPLSGGTVGSGTPPPVCGVAPAKGSVQRLVVGGKDAVRGAWPWMVSLTRTGSTKVHFCGGVLISRQHVLTAAHCVNVTSNVIGPNDFKVRIGAYNLSEPADDVTSQDVDVIKVSVHAEYNLPYHDIAILKIKEPTLRPALTPICLPPATMTGQPLAEDTQSVLIGWGKTGFNQTKYEGGTSEILQELAGPVLSPSDCRKYFENISFKTKEGDPVDISEKYFICSGDVDNMKNACMGDSGGPLMVQSAPIGWVVVGVVSVGSTRCGAVVPTLYTSVSEHLDWIQGQISA